MAEWFALLTSDHEAPGLNRTGGRIQLMTVVSFIAQSFSLSPFHRRDNCMKMSNLIFLEKKKENYCIRPNYRTVRLGFSKLLGTLSCVKICIILLRVLYKKRSEKDLFDDDYTIFFF